MKTRVIAPAWRPLAVAALLTALALLGAFAVPSTDAAPAGNCTYYNNAAHSQVVGRYGYDCCNNYIAWGIKTAYYTCSPACFICYPPPPQ